MSVRALLLEPFDLCCSGHLKEMHQSKNLLLHFCLTQAPIWTITIPFSIWLGVNDIATESVFVYTDGSPVQWTSWANGPPNGTRPFKNCVIRKNGSNNWKDKNCLDRYNFYCQSGETFILIYFLAFLPYVRCSPAATNGPRSLISSPYILHTFRSVNPSHWQ